MLYLEKSQYLNSIFQLNYTKYAKNVMVQNCLLHKDLKVWKWKFFYKMYIFLFILKNTIEKAKFNFLTIIYVIYEKIVSLQNCLFQWDL